MNGLTVFSIDANGNLKISLTDAGREEVKDKTECHLWYGDDLFLELCEGPLCNGWQLIPPEDIGALTDSLIFSDDVQHDDDGKITDVGAHYWFPDYQIRSPAQDLAEYGFVIFTKAS